MILIHNSTLRRFLGIERFRELYKAYTAHSKAKSSPQIHLGMLLLALTIGCGPLLLGILQRDLNQQFLTPLIGISACLSIFYRRKLRLEITFGRCWIDSLRLTHTAFALGCIPAVVILIFHPAALFQVSETILPGSSELKPQIDRLTLIGELLLISLWAGFTEELIFRGMLLSAIRRWNRFSSGSLATTVAILLSAAIFALGHLPVWGPGLCLAVFGIGIGLGLAYVAIDEQLLPLICYHAIFDFLSLCFSLLTFK